MPELANAQRRPSDPVSAGARAAHVRQEQGREGEAPLAAGNQALQRRLGAARAVQTKLEVSQPGDAWEREADAAAARVMRMPDGSAGAASAAPPAISRLPAGAAGPLGRKEAAAPEDDRKARKATEKEASEAKAKAAAKEGEAAKKTEKEKKKEEDESKKMVHPLAIAGERARADEGVERAIEARRGQGVPLPAEERAFFEPRFGRRLDHVRVHADAAAARAARDVRAQAFATGNEVFFGAGRYQPGTPHGRALLAHELAHTIQQSPGPSLPAREPARPASPDVRTPAPAAHTPAPAAHAPANASAPRPGVPAPFVAPPRAATPAPAPRAAAPAAPRTSAAAPGRAAPAPARAVGPAAAPAAARMVARAPAPTAKPAAAPGQPAPGGGGEIVPLTASFQPPASVAERIKGAGKEGADVQVALGRIAAGTIRVREKGGGKKDDKAAAAYETVDRKKRPAHQPIPITHPLLEPLRAAGVDPVLAVKVADGTVEGYASVGAAEGKAPQRDALKKWITDHPREMKWAGLDNLKLPALTNELSGGTLKVGVPEFAFTLGGFVDGKGSFALANEVVTFSASATITVPKLTTATLDVTRKEDGSLYGRAEVPVSMANFSGTLIGEFGNGTFNMQGTVSYSTEKMDGEVTLLVTDKKTADKMVADRLGAPEVEASAKEAAGAQTTEAQAPPTDAGPKPGPRAVAGWGTLNFHFTEWMAGTANVVVDADGDVTVRGKIAPPATVTLFEQRDYRQDLFDFEVKALYGVPLVGNLFIFASLGLDAVARLGPGTLSKIEIGGEYSTKPGSFTKFSIKGTVNISAYAGLELRAEGGAGLELLGHDLKAGVGVFAVAGIKGYVEATPELGYEEKADPKAGKRGEFFLRGHMEIAAQPFLGLGGDLFVELDSPWWSPAPDKKWTWPLGQMEYPLPGQFGIGADVDYPIGSDKLPEIKFGKVDFDKEKFLTDIVRDDVPRKQKKDKEQKGSFTEKGGGTPDTAAAGNVQGGGKTETKNDKKGATKDPKDQQQTPGTDVQARWLGGMKEVGELAEKSKKEPLGEKEINAALKDIKKKYSFKLLKADRDGEDWLVRAKVNSESVTKVEGKSRPSEIEGQQTPRLDELTEAKPKRPVEFVEGWRVYKVGRTKYLEVVPYVELRSTLELGRLAEKPGLDAYNAKTNMGATKNNKVLEILGENGEVKRRRIPDLYIPGKLVGDIKDVQYQSLDEQMKDDYRIAIGDNVRHEGEKDYAPAANRFDLVVRGPSVTRNKGTDISAPLRGRIEGEGRGEICDVITK